MKKLLSVLSGVMLFAATLFAVPSTPINNPTFSGTVTSLAPVLSLNGTAAAPSYSFTNSPTTGFFRSGADEIGVSIAGSQAFRFNSNGANTGRIYGGAVNNNLELTSAGAVNLSAAGTNQSITLTPSGTGQVVNTSSGGTRTESQGFNAGLNWVSNTNSASTQRLWQINGTTYMLLATTGNLLLGGLTTDGTGVLQFPAATTSAGGITLGNVNIYQSASNVVDFFANGLTVAEINGTQAAFRIGSTCTIQNQNGSVSNPSYSFVNDNSSGMFYGGSSLLKFATAGTLALTLDSSQNATFAKKITSYNGVATAGWGVGAIQAAAEITAQSAAATITTYTVGAADGTFEVAAQLDCTAATALVTTLTCTYTDKGNTARTMILPVAQLSGSFIASGAITGTGAWETPVMHIRAKASTVITILTSTGTFTGVVYSADATITQKN